MFRFHRIFPATLVTWLVFALVACSIPARAQETGYQQFEIESGLPSNHVMAIHTDSRG